MQQQSQPVCNAAGLKLLSVQVMVPVRHVGWNTYLLLAQLGMRHNERYIYNVIEG